MSSVIFASPLKAASPLAQSVYDPTAVARPILKKDAEASVLFEDPAFALMLAPSSRPAAKPVKKSMPLPARADPRYNPVKIAKSEASLSTRIFLQTKPHAGETVVGAQRFLAFNRDSELRQFKRQLADTAPVAVAIGHSQSFARYLQQNYGASSAVDESPSDALDGRDSAQLYDSAEQIGLAEGGGVLRNDTEEALQYPVEQSSDEESECNLRDASSASSDGDGDVCALLAARDDPAQEQHVHRSDSAASEANPLAPMHSEPSTDSNAGALPPFKFGSPPEVSLTPARMTRVATPPPAQQLDVPGFADVRKHTPTSYSALHAARLSPSVTASASSATKTSSRSQTSRVGSHDTSAKSHDTSAKSHDTSAKPARAAPTAAPPPSFAIAAPPPSFAELSKYSQQVVNELASTQQMEAQYSAKIAQRDLLRLRDSFHRVTSAENSAKQLSKASSWRSSTKSHPYPAAHDCKQAPHLSEPTPPRSRQPVPNSVGTRPTRASNAGVYDIDEADVSAPLARAASPAMTPKQHRAASVMLPSVSPFFHTPERPSAFAANNHVEARCHDGFSRPAPLSLPLHIPLPAVDSVPCTPRPSTPPQPIQNQASFQTQSSAENDRLSLIPHHHHVTSAPEHFTFIDLEAPQPPPYPDSFVNRSAPDSPRAERDVRADLPRFGPLFQLTDDRDHDVFAAISALSAPLDSLVAPQSRFDPRLWLSVIDTDSDIGVRIQRMRAAYLVMTSLVQKDETEVKCSFKRLNELRVDLLWQTKRRQLRFWLNSSGHIVLGPRKKEVVMRFLGLTPASKHAKSISIKEPAPGCSGVSADKRWQGSDFKIQLMVSLVSKYQLHLAFVQFKMNAARARALRHVLACLSLANGRRYILLGWSCFKSWHTSRTRTRDVAVRSGSNKWFYFLQLVLRSWCRFVSLRGKRQRSIAHFQHSVDLRTLSNSFKRWSSGIRVRKHGDVLSSAAGQFWYLTCSLRCILRWWQGAQNLAARKQALRAFAGSNSGNITVESKPMSSEGVLKTRSLLSKTEVDEQLRLKRTLAIRRRKQLLSPLKILLQQQKLAVSALTSRACAPDPRHARKAEPSTSEVAVSAAARRLFSRTFCIWKELSDTSARAKDLNRKISARCKNRTFVFWKYIIALRRGFSSLASRMQISCSRRMLSLWLTRARAEKQCLHSISNRCRLRFLHSVVSSWKIVGRIDALASDWRLKRHFAMWLRALPMILLDQDREGSRLNHLRVTRSTFCKWRSCVQRNKRLLALLLRGQLLYCKHLLVVVWTSWRLITAAASLRSGTVKRLRARRHARAMNHAFASWLSHLGNTRLLRRVFGAAAERWHLVHTLNAECARSDSHVMMDHFCAWRRDVKAVKQERLLKSIHATAVVYQSIRRRRSILLSWSRWAYCSLTARKQLERARLALLRGSVSSWASLAVVTKALARRVEVRYRRKRLECCIACMRAAVLCGKCRRGPVARRYFGALKWYGQAFCVDLPQQHRSRVLQQLVVQAWARVRLMTLKIVLGELTTSRHVLRRKFVAWIAHTGNRKRAIISHRLANAHSTYSTKKRVFCALKRRLADAAREFFLLGKAILSNSRRCLNAGFHSWRAAASAQRELRLAPHPPAEAPAPPAAASEVRPAVASSPAAFQQEPPSMAGSSVVQAAFAAAQVGRVLDARADAASEPLQQQFRGIPVTVAQSTSAASSAAAANSLNAANLRQRQVSQVRAAAVPQRAQQRVVAASQVAEAARATHGTQTTASSKPKRPPLAVEKVARRQGAGEGPDVVVVGRPVVSSFLLSEPKLANAARSPPASPRLAKFKSAT